MNTDYKDFLIFRIKNNIDKLTGDTLQETYYNIVNHSIDLILEDYLFDKIELNTIFENVPRKNENVSINTKVNNTSKPIDNSKKTDNSATSKSTPESKPELKDSYGKIENNPDMLKAMAIPTITGIVGFGAREAGIRKGLFTGITQKVVHFKDSETAKAVGAKLAENNPSLLGNVKHISGDSITVNSDILTKALANGEVTTDMLKGGAKGASQAITGGAFMDTIGNAAAGTLTAMAASMATRMAINVIRKKIQKKREEKKLHEQNK